MTRACASCGRSFEARRSTAKYCGSSCRARASQGTKPAKAVVPAAENALCAAIRRELEAADRLDSVLGQQALRLAERIDAQADTGSAIASLSKELRAVMDAALADAPKAADALDELAKRRRLKASGA